MIAAPQQRRFALGALVGVALLASQPGWAGTTVMISPTRDTAIYAENTNANGAGGSLFLGRNRAGNERRTLIAFDDLSAIPAGATIVSVELEVRATRGRGGSLSVSVHELTADWGEGASVAGGAGGQGGAASNGGATWQDRFFPNTDWQQAGGDFAATQLSTVNVPTSGTATFPSTPGLVASVQAWLNGSAPNNGWLLRADPGAGVQSAKRIGSREGSSGTRPVLLVTFEQAGPVTPTGLAISGPATIDEGTSAAYTATATFSDGSMADVTGETDWSQDSPFATIDALGILTAAGVDGDQPVTITASFQSGGVEVGDAFEATILDLGQPVNYGLAGGWFNTATPGQGFLFDFLLDGNFMFVAAFTFDTAPAPKGGSIDGAEQRWFTAQGSYAGNRGDLTIFATRNGVFDDPTPPVTQPVGTMEVEFQSCTQATITYDLPSFGLSGVIPVVKLLADEICTQIVNGEIELKSAGAGPPAPSGGAQPINYGLIGGWFDPATAGQGFLIDFLLDTQFMFVAWFTFDTAQGQKGGSIPGSELRWLTAQGSYTTSGANLTLFATRNGVFDDPTPTMTDPVGTMGIEFDSCITATLTYDLPGFGLSGSISAVKLLADEICTAINDGLIDVK